MFARLPSPSKTLQWSFAWRAHRESNGHFVLPWQRGLLRNASSLDPIYTALGADNLDYGNVRALLNSLKNESTRRYAQTIQWLREYLNNDFAQQGNSCGAWSLTHLIMKRGGPHALWDHGTFINRSNDAYNGPGTVKFQAADWPGPAAAPLELTAWIGAAGGAYANPWKIAQKLGGAGRLCLDNGVRAAVNNPGGDPMLQKLQGLLAIVEQLRRPAPAPIPNGDLSVIAPNSGTIIVTCEALNTDALHYMLLWRTATEWIIYNSNSSKLNPARLPGGCPRFGGLGAVMQTDLLDANGGNLRHASYLYLGMYIVP